MDSGLATAWRSGMTSLRAVTSYTCRPARRRPGAPIRHYSLFAHYHFPDRPGVVLREEQPAVGERRDAARAAVRRRNVVFAAHRAVGRHATDLVGEVRGVPEVAVGADGDAAQRRIRRRHRMLGDGASTIDAAERIGRSLD